jgi:hypothetical protein
MFFLSYINLPLFFVSFIVGMFIVYVCASDIKEIYVYNLPETMEYTDEFGEHFIIEKEKVECKGNEKIIKNLG